MDYVGGILGGLGIQGNSEEDSSEFLTVIEFTL